MKATGNRAVKITVLQSIYYELVYRHHVASERATDIFGKKAMQYTPMLVKAAQRQYMNAVRSTFFNLPLSIVENGCANENAAEAYYNTLNNNERVVSWSYVAEIVKTMPSYQHLAFSKTATQPIRTMCEVAALSARDARLVLRKYIAACDEDLCAEYDKYSELTVPESITRFLNTDTAKELLGLPSNCLRSNNLEVIEMNALYYVLQYSDDVKRRSTFGNAAYLGEWATIHHPLRGIALAFNFSPNAIIGSPDFLAMADFDVYYISQLSGIKQIVFDASDPLGGCDSNPQFVVANCMTPKDSTFLEWLYTEAKALMPPPPEPPKENTLLAKLSANHHAA